MSGVNYCFKETIVLLYRNWQTDIWLWAWVRTKVRSLWPWRCGETVFCSGVCQQLARSDHPRE